MTEHLPECCVGTDDCKAEPCQRCHACCICEQLRACEERVRKEESRTVIGSVSLADIGEANVQQYKLGYSAGLDAAWEAFDEDDMPPRWWKSMFFGGRRARHWCQYGWDWKKRDALTAIDALRGESNG